MGLYKCYAHNSHGSDHVDTFIYPVSFHIAYTVTQTAFVLGYTTCAAQVQSWVRASGLVGFDGHAMRLSSQAAMEDLSVSERFRAVD